ncbi:MAG TPA: winged helix-turn-helix domain-containing protein [Pyrinomonadaceae bacterium]|jgi:DNA-binding winged helix-turn-helix (wHTH) protein/tetratricopeptide (TPR) repeat protein
MEIQDIELYEFDSFRIDVVKRRLLRNDRTVKLATKDFDILLLLVTNIGRIVTKEELISQIWPNQFVEENNLTVRISALRKSLGESRTKPKYIQTVQGRGYRFVARVRAVEAQQAVRAKPKEPDVQMSASSIAVLPFSILGERSKEEFLGQGIADAIITKLGKIRRVRVPPTTAVLRYANAEIDIQEIGEKLEVDSILTGQIQKMAERIRVTVQLTTTQRWQVLWAKKFDESFTNIFAVEDRISELVANALVDDLSAAEHEGLTKRYTENAEAYRYYLEGRYFWNKRTEYGLQRGIKCFERAAELDPDYALAYTGIALCSNMLYSYGILPPAQCIPRIKEAASRALEIDNTIGEAYASLGHIYLMHDWDFPKAEEYLRRATELSPNNPTAHHWYALYFRIMGRLDESFAELNRAHNLDPLSLIIKSSIAGNHYYARQYDLALAKCREVFDLDPNFYIVYGAWSLAYAFKGMYKEAIATIQKAVAIENDIDALGTLEYIYSMAGDRGETGQQLERLKSLSKNRHIWPFHLAVIYAGLGDKEQAFNFLERALKERNQNVLLLKVDPRLDSLRSDPRFVDILHRIGFDRR